MPSNIGGIELREVSPVEPPSKKAQNPAIRKASPLAFMFLLLLLHTNEGIPCIHFPEWREEEAEKPCFGTGFNRYIFLKKYIEIYDKKTQGNVDYSSSTG